MPIEEQLDGHVVTITIRGPSELNPMTNDMYIDLHAALLRFDDDPVARVAILRGGGDKHFSVGGNLKALNRGYAAQTTDARVRGFWYPGTVERTTFPGHHPVYTYRPVKPIVGAFVGYCLGAGLILAGYRTSIRIAGTSAWFGLSEVRLGLGGSALVKSGLLDQIPFTACMWLLSGERIDAAHALRIGLVNEVVPDADVFARAQAVADVIADMPPSALRAEKEALLHAERLPFARAVKVAAALEALDRVGSDASDRLG